MATHRLDDLDRAIIRTFTDDPHVGVLAASRQLGVARGTVTARLARLSDSGVIASWAPHLDPAALGHPVTAMVTLQIRQVAGHDAVVEHLAGIPQVLEVHTITGYGDLFVRVVARSNADLQDVLDEVTAHEHVVRASTNIALATRIAHRTLPLVG
ncbi:AsnC family transcriptional regulator [Kytococcus schroeteri]|uniref:AsnC family transcriptional regulator n=1 Tax=Kytococcus schroeteri TaxID=138300 RepID=A0A2I1PBH9_9MICO|nr:Lrp/AsnC family transcriptional regulator [Kytococcus schroeteri]PKZ41964.1 AsnC family transcriptional regulator [Kytococcus schroeteri]